MPCIDPHPVGFDYMRVVDEFEGVTIEGQSVTEVVYVFTSPQSAVVNANWIREQLERFSHLRVELFDTTGAVHAFRQQDLADLDGFLGGL